MSSQSFEESIYQDDPLIAEEEGKLSNPSSLDQQFPPQTDNPISESMEFIDQHFSEDKDLRLSGEERLKLEIMRDLQKPCNKKEYSQKLKIAAQRLGKSVRQVRRDFEAWQKYGPASIMPSPRADQGKPRKSKEYWHNLAIKIFKAGNKGKNTLARHKVVERIEIRAYELAKLELKPEITELENRGSSGADLDWEVQQLIETKQESGGFEFWKKYGPPPSRRTVERWLKPLEEANHTNTPRSPGWHGSKLALKTRSDRIIEIRFSNQVWQIDHTKGDILLIDEDGNILGRPILTTVIDTYSRCIVGCRLGFSAPSSQVTALALRHAILPKRYSSEYKLRSEWGTYGTPKYLFTDGGKDFRSIHMIEWIADQIGFEPELRHRPSEGGIVERPFRTMSQLMSDVEGFVGANILERPENAEARACLTLADLEWLIIGFIVDSYNQKADSRTKSNPFQAEESRINRWRNGLHQPPTLMQERELDICLMKAEERVVYDGGKIKFSNLIYKGENLGAFTGNKVILRFDPRDITILFVYERKNNREKFLARAYAMGFESTRLSKEDIDLASKNAKKGSKGINNITIKEEAIRRQEFLKQKTNKSKAERRKLEEEKHAPLPKWREEEATSTSKVIETTEIKSEEQDAEPTEKFDYSLMREELGL